MPTNAVQIVAAPAEKTPDLIEKIQTMGLEYGMKVLSALLILFLGLWVAKQLKKVLINLLERSRVDVTLVSFLASLAHLALQAFVLIAALERLDVKTASFITLIGAAGLAVGLALQGSLSNFAAGVLMIIFKPLKVGEVVDAGGVLGTVREIGIFTTMIDTLDNKRAIVPNAKLTSDTIVNHSVNQTRRVDLVAGISYGDDIDKARGAIQSALKEVPGILASPAPEIVVQEMADSSVNFAVRPWCRPTDYWAVYFGATEAIKKKFDADGITIPFPQRDVHLYEHKGA